MSLTTTVNRISYTAGAGQTTFAYPFTIYDATDLQVYVSGVLQSSGYTVTNVGVDGGGNVVFSVGLSGGQTVLIIRVEPATQLTVLPTSGPFPAKAVEKMSDKLTMEIQQLQEILARSLKLAVTSAFADLLVPDPVTGKFLRWKDATQLENADITSGGVLGLPVSTANGGTGASYASALALALGLNLALWKQGADIVAAATITLPNPLDGGLIKITGNTGVGAISTAGVSIGAEIAFLFTGTPVLTHGANFYLQGAVNYTVAANDILVFQLVSATKWQEVRRVNAAAAVGKFWRDDGTWQPVPITKGDLLSASAANVQALLAVGSNGKVLVADSTQATGLKWVDASIVSQFGANFFESADQTVPLSSALSVAHGLGAKPKLWTVVLKNTTAELGYSIGDEIPIGNSGTAATPHGVADATNVVVVTPSGLNILNKSTFAVVALTPGSWKYVVRAWK
jgi:hypothetical protein